MRWLGLLTPLLAACGSSASSDGPLPAPSPDYEGPNFYEPGATASGPVPTIPSDFYEFLGGDEPVAACSRGPVPEPVSSSPDPALVCPPLSSARLSDFTFMGGDPSGVTFGPDSSVSGGTYYYPQGALTSDLSGNDWHLSGTVDAVSGFGIYMNGCRELDASAYRGIFFTLSGHIGEGGGLVFFVGTAANQISHLWLNANKASDAVPDEPPNVGRCTPVGLQYDGSCREARIGIDVTEQQRPVTVEWQYLSQGCPEPSVSPGEITSIAWYFPQVATGPYDVDIHLDDLRFTADGPL
jgi:hypothetical protein